MRPGWRTSRKFYAALAVAAALAAYGNSLKNSFIGDDHLYVENNPFVKEPRNLAYLVDPRYYLGKHQVLVGNRPVFLASLLTDRLLWHDNPAGYHATNVLLHAANTYLVYTVAGGLGASASAAFWPALFFGLHPVQTEAVNVVSFRADLLCTLFFLLALLSYLAARRHEKPVSGLWLGCSAACFALAILSKEMAATFPAIALLVEYYFPAARGRRYRIPAACAAFLIVACAYAGFWSTRFHYGGMAGVSVFQSAAERMAAAMPTAPVRGWFHLGIERERIFNQSPWEWNSLFSDRSAFARAIVRSLGTYLWLFVFPLHLVADRAPILTAHWTDAGTLLSLLAIGTLAAYAITISRRDAPSAFGAAWCLIAIAPVLNLIPLYNPVAERYLYLVTVGVSLMMGSAVARCSESRSNTVRTAGLLIGCLIAAAFGARTFARNLDWRSERALYLQNEDDGEQSSNASFIRAGLLEEDGHLIEASNEYRASLSKRPGFVEALLGLGKVEGELGDRAGARREYERALAASPNDPMVAMIYAVFLAKNGLNGDAVALYRRAIAIAPDYLQAWVNLGALYRDQGKFKEAKECYEQAIRLAPPGDPLPFYSYATLLEKTGDWKGAMARYHDALERNPGFEPARARLNALNLRHGDPKSAR